MEITNDLIIQWEPKIHKFLQNTFVIGMDKEDLAQELRIAILKAAKHYNDDKGVSFHTYLHTVMVNTIRTLISKAQKNKEFVAAYSIDGHSRNEDLVNTKYHISNEISKSLEDPVSIEHMSEMELQDVLERADLSDKEFDFIELRMDGLTMEQISNVVDYPAYRLRSSIQKKLRETLKGEEFSYEEKIS